MGFARQYLEEASRALDALDDGAIDALAALIAEVRDRGGRLFVVGVGGGAAHAAHAVADFRTLAGIEAYAPTDNAPELTARINDGGWAGSFAAWLRGSRLGRKDLVLVLSVGGGDRARQVSPNVVEALALARKVGARIAGIVGRDGGYTARVADACVVVPTVHPDRVTAHTEGLQSVVLHLLVSHPRLNVATPRWESLTRDFVGRSGSPRTKSLAARAKRAGRR
ncbi:MAG: SIS domain-containing protein [Myxococcales bacterium]